MEIKIMMNIGNSPLESDFETNQGKNYPDE